MIKYLLLLAALLCQQLTFGQVSAPRVLIINAHPDDEIACSATVYKITHELKGVVDLALITNGEGGYKYSTLAESYYNLELTDEKIGRANLPRIRKQELMNAGKILGIRKFFFLDQLDRKYTLDERDPLDSSWDVGLVMVTLQRIMMNEKYDYIFCLLPVPETHGHHKAATMIALQTVNNLPEENKPIVLGVTNSGRNDSVQVVFTQLKDYKETAILKDAPSLVMDRSVKFGYKDKLSYFIIVNWANAEHKSQGTIQQDMNKNDFENFWYFEINGKKGIEKTQQLFEELKNVPYPVKTY
jgi:LmbE family N-acetylglucosaminyl deacetylase